jgi:NAD(P) transhydrogenase
MPAEAKKYDMIVIGGGPAGITAATTAAALHKTVALINCHRELGGAGINTGTVPSKTLRETALALSGLKSRNLYGVDLSLRREVTLNDFLGHEQKVKSGFNLLLSQQLASQKADVYCGTGGFVDPYTIKVEPFEKATGNEEILLHCERVLVATGSAPIRPELFPFGQGEIYDSDSILQLDRIPKTLAVIGAGVVGSEYGSTFSALGSHVHIIDGRDVLLPFLDLEISRALVGAMEHNGVTFHWKEKVQACQVQESGAILLQLTSGASLTVDAVLVAAGRKSNTENLGLPLAGVTLGERGIVPVNADYRTNIDHIYAAGDVIGFPALASTSMEQARRAVRHAFGLKATNLSPLLPNGIYTIPEVSMVGETEESLQKKKVDYVVGRAKYVDNARGRIIGDEEGFLKLLFRRSDLKLIGVHVMGELATEIVHIGLMAMLTDGSANIFVEACFNTPTLSSLYKSAALNAISSTSD